MKYDKYLRRFMPSDEMYERLKEEPLHPREIAELIFNSPTPAKEKLEALRDLRGRMKDAGDKEECGRYLWNVEKAWKLAEAKGVFSVESQYYLPEDGETITYLVAACCTIEDALDQAKKDSEENWDDEDRHWYRAKKWTPGDGGKLRKVCDYVIAGNEVLFTELNREEFPDAIYVCSHMDLETLPVPFKAGDIIEIGGFPFIPKSRVLILDIGDNRDCCCVQGLARCPDGKWRIGAVKHGGIGVAYDALYEISPLYSARLFDGKLPEEDASLAVAKAYLKANPKEIVRHFSFDFSITSGMTTEELLALCGADPATIAPETGNKNGCDGKAKAQFEAIKFTGSERRLT